jgi:hypothetical protein
MNGSDWFKKCWILIKNKPRSEKRKLIFISTKEGGCCSEIVCYRC